MTGRPARERQPRVPAPIGSGWYSLARVTPRSILTARTLLVLLGSIQAKVGRPPDGFDAVLWTERRPSGDVIGAWQKVGVDLFDVGPAPEGIAAQGRAIRQEEFLTPSGGRAP